MCKCGVLGYFNTAKTLPETISSLHALIPRN